MLNEENLMKKDGSITLPSWRMMLIELIASGYKISELSRIIGIDRKSISRWLKGKSELPPHALFSKFLYFYSYHRSNEKIVST